MGKICLIDKLVHGGQGIGTLADGRRVFVWNALPGESVELTVTRSKNKLAQAVATKILDASPHRIEPRDAAYLSTSPWQIMTFNAENQYKQEILAETLDREHVVYEGPVTMQAGADEWHYRNKMEYSFWADDSGLHLALFNRGTHGKQIVPGSSIAMEQVDQQADAILKILDQNDIRGSQLKTLVVRSNQIGETVSALFVKDELFPDIAQLASVGKGVAVYFSTPKSPASVLTRKLYEYGDLTLTDDVLGHKISYDVNSFFQVNLGIFIEALAVIQQAVGKDPYVDMYSGVGTIGLCLGGGATLVDSDKHNCHMAVQNVGSSGAQVIHTTAENALEFITHDQQLIVDPPRAGLHARVTQQILNVMPPKVIYLSCNPATQARDLAHLQAKYRITQIIGYNFFPRTPHIESLAILELKK